MWLAIYIVFWALNILFVFNNRSNRFISAVSYLLMAMMFVLNDGTSGDAFIYKNDFANNGLNTNWSEPGYGLFKTIIIYFGINTYNGLLLAIFIFTSIFIIIGLKYFDCSYNPILAITMPFIFPTCAVAIRLFMAIGIIIFSLRFLVEKKPFFYIIGIIIASMFHRTALIYLILLVCIWDGVNSRGFIKKNVSKLVLIISVITIVLTYISGRLPFIDILIKIVSAVYKEIDAKINAYTGTLTHYGACIFFAIYFMGLIFSICIKRQIQEEKISSNDDMININSFADINYRVHLLLSVSLPFIVTSLIYYRILMIGFITNAILYGMYMKRTSITKGIMCLKINKSSLMFFCSCIVWFLPEVVRIHDISISGLMKVSVETFFK